MSAARRLTDKQVAEAVELVKDADSVELKLTVADADQRSAVAALDLDILDAEPRQVVFFDTPDLRLDRSGVVVRARRIRKGGDTTVKLRPVVPAELSGKLRKTKGFGVEVDAMPGGVVCSASLKRNADNAEIRRVLAGKRPVAKLFGREQRALYEKHAPAGLELDELVPLGPISLLKLRFEPKDLGRRVVAEAWFYPDGSRILELSTKCAPGEAFQAAVEMRTFLTGRGIDLTAEQQTKTRAALEYFARIRGGDRVAQPA